MLGSRKSKGGTPFWKSKLSGLALPCIIFVVLFSVSNALAKYHKIPIGGKVSSSYSFHSFWIDFVEYWKYGKISGKPSFIRYTTEYVVKKEWAGLWRLEIHYFIEALSNAKEGTYEFEVEYEFCSSKFGPCLYEETVSFEIEIVSGAKPHPIADIKINSLDGPVTLSQSDALNVTVALDNKGRTKPAEWWLAADTPFGLYFFTFEGWTTDWIPAYQGPLFPLDSYEVLNMPVSGLPPGTYTLYFGVDTYMDRNVTWDSVYYDTVVVNITEANGYVSPTILWEKTFGGTDHDSGYSVQQTSDGGYIIVGETSSYGAGDFDVYLIKTDSEGNRMWEKTFGGTKGDHGYSVQQTSDGGYIIVGETSSYGVGYTNVYLIKTNPEGNLVWQKTFGSFDGTGYNSGHSVKQISDGSYVIVGSNGSDVYLIKVDSQGNLVWEKTFGGTKGDHGCSVQQTSDGGYIIVGKTSSYGAGNFDVYLIKTDSEGNLVWEKTFGGTSWDDGECVQQTSDGGYIIVGQTGWTTPNSDVYLIKVDSQGNLVWEKTFGGTDHDSGYSVQQTSDGGYIVVGATGSVGLSWRDIYLLKVDSQGNLAWEKTFGGTKSTWGPSIERTSDGAYVIVGGIEYDEANKEDVLLAKIKEQ